jgi:aryl-alcohol dehydrogenase-like predicted oxidoreductase
MQTRRMGRTGLYVTPICFGGNVLGWTTDQQRSFDVLDTFVAGGGNFIDSADVYSRWAPGHVGGESERILGDWMQARNNRTNLIIATKVGMRMDDGPNGEGLSRYRIIKHVEDSLKRLKTDYIDLYQSHADDLNTPLDETLRAYDDLISSGKVRYIGASNFAAWRLTKALWVSDRHNLARYECVQPRYNLVMRADYERELEPMCISEGVGVISYSSLASGFFSGKYRAGQALPTSPRAGGVQANYMNERGFKILAAVDAVAKELNTTSGQVALAWIMARPGITAAIASGTTVDQVKDLTASAELVLPGAAIASLTEASN